MTRYSFRAESGANGDALSTGNTGFDVISFSGASTAQISTTQKAHGTRSMYFVCPASSGVAYGSKTIAGTDVAAVAYFYWGGMLTGSDTTVIWFGNGTSQRAHVEVTTAGAIRFRDDASVAQWNGSVTTSVGALPTAGWYRIEFRSNMATGTARLAAYSLDSTTPLTNLDSGARTGLNFGSDSFNTFRLGPKASTNSAGTTGLYIDEGVVDDSASSTFIGPYTETLATPTVTVGTIVNPTTVGGSNGSVAVSWPAVAGATSYDAYRATGATPSQGDFVLVASGVTSPYNFTGQTQGTRSYGIKAKA